MLRALRFVFASSLLQIAFGFTEGFNTERGYADYCNITYSVQKSLTGYGTNGFGCDKWNYSYSFNQGKYTRSFCLDGCTLNASHVVNYSAGYTSWFFRNCPEAMTPAYGGSGTDYSFNYPKMWWTGKPKNTTVYTVRSGDGTGPDVTTYVPNEWMTITIRVTQPQWQYKGLLMYATSVSAGKEKYAGAWDLPREPDLKPFGLHYKNVTETNPIGTHACPNSVMHQSGLNKPYVTQFRFKGPPSGTGTITIQAMIKDGPPNPTYKGDFWIPKPLVLTESTAANRTRYFNVAGPGQSCTDYCSSKNLPPCTSATLTNPDFNWDIPQIFNCHPALMHTCSLTYNAAKLDSGYCYTHDSAAQCANVTYNAPDCSYKLPANDPSKMFCACSSSPTNPPTLLPSRQPTTPLPTQLPTLQPSTSIPTAKPTFNPTMAANCSDKIMNQNETGIDCGGICPACKTNCSLINCGGHGNCTTSPGLPGKCVCTGNFTGNFCEVDPCVVANCSLSFSVCAGGVCSCLLNYTGPRCTEPPPATCSDGIKNRDEVNIDCGGSSCLPCPTFSFLPGNWTECSLPCGNGTRTRKVPCVNELGMTVNVSNCQQNLTHPLPSSESCNIDPCPSYAWKEGTFGGCSVTCNNGTQSRSVTCVSSVGDVVVNDTLCTTTKPSTTQVCANAACVAPYWLPGPYGDCSVACGGGVRNRSVVCMDNNQNKTIDDTLCAASGKPVGSQACNLIACVTYGWFACPNFYPCTAQCNGGLGMVGKLYRDVFCRASSGEIVDSVKCTGEKPQTEQSVCNTQPCSTHAWMADGNWGACLPDPIDGKMYRSRTFHCHAPDGSNAQISDCTAMAGPRPVSKVQCAPNSCLAVAPEPIQPPIAPISSTTRTTSSLLWVATSALLGCRNFPARGAGAVAFLMYGMAFAQADNWILGTGGRSGFTNLIFPVFPQTNKSTIHIQVAPGQEFMVEWAVAHDFITYFAIIKASDEFRLQQTSYTMLDEYFNNCTKNNNGFDKDPRWGSAVAGFDAQQLANYGPLQKFHRSPMNFNWQSNVTTANKPVAPNAMFDSLVLPSHPDYLGERPKSPVFRMDIQEYNASYTSWPTAHFDVPVCTNTSAWYNTSCFQYPYSRNNVSQQNRYKSTKLFNDRRCRYANAKMPWVIEAARFEHTTILNTPDVARFTIGTPGNRLDAGRYILWYVWTSYFDSIDIEVVDPADPAVSPLLVPNPKDSSQKIVSNPYGNITYSSTSQKFDRLDHCVFEYPRKIGSSCIEVLPGDSSGGQCRNACSRDYNCKGFMMVPLGDPNMLAFPSYSPIPWFNGTPPVNRSDPANHPYCDKSAFAGKPSGTQVCYTIHEFANRDSGGELPYNFFFDTEDIGFYSTCYLGVPLRTFDIPQAKLPESLIQFRYNNKCIPCEDRKMSQMAPDWRVTSYCMDCDNEYSTLNYRNTSSVIYSWTKSNSSAIFNSTNVKVLHPAGSPVAMETECRQLAATDSECSPFVAFNINQFTGMTDGKYIPNPYYPPLDPNDYENTNVYIFNSWKANSYTDADASCKCLKKTAYSGSGIPSLKADMYWSIYKII